MLIYKQRYKPRTTREFTKNDLTVYDSAGNTALNALTVYGKSEVVDGAITSAGDSGSIEVQTCKKNLLDPTKLVTGNITYTDGVLSGTAGSFYTAYRTGIPVLFNKARQITFSIKAYTSSSYNIGRGLLVNFVYADNTKDTMEMLNNTITPQFFTLTSNPAKQMQYISIIYGDGGSNMWHLSEIQLEYGASATTYEPYTGTMAVFSTGTPLRGIPDTTVRDVMEWYDSSGEVTKKCYEADLGASNWGNASEGDNCFYTNLPNTDGYHKATLMAKYTQVDTVQQLTTIDKTYCRTSGAFIVIHDTDYTDPAAFKAAMSGVMLVYELATPTTEQLTSTENASIAGLRTFTPQTHAQNNAGAEMTVDYTIRVPTI